MPLKIGYSARETGQTLYAVIVDSDGKYWSTVQNQFVAYGGNADIGFDLFFDVSQYASRTGGPYAGIQNNLVWSPTPMIQAPLGVCSCYSTDDVTQLYINRGAGTGDHDLVPLYNNYYNGDQSLIYDMISNISDWLDVYVPDSGFTGIIDLDFERPVRYAWLSVTDQDDWTADTYNNAGEDEYNAFVQLVVETIITEVKALRPNARIGWFDWPPMGAAGTEYYGNPSILYSNTSDVQYQIDQAAWLPAALDVMMPASGYLQAKGDSAEDNWSSAHVTPEWNEDFVTAPIIETKRLLAAAGLTRPIYLYCWARYSRDTLGYAMMEDYDLRLIFEQFEAQDLDGMIFWQSFGADDAASLAEFTDYEDWISGTFVPVFYDVFGTGSDFNISLTESAGKFYSGTVFMIAPDGDYTVRIYEQAGSTPDFTTDTLVQAEPFSWRDNNEVTLSTPIVVTPTSDGSDTSTTLNKIWQETLKIASKVKAR